MANVVEIGAAVWVRTADGITEGVIATVGSQGESLLSSRDCVTIVLSGGHSVLTTSVLLMGDHWGLLEHDSPPRLTT
jgi:hypothetical protein